LTKYVKSQKIFLDRILNQERRTNGLIILDAYYGLDEHIYQIDAGLMIYKLPETI